MVVRKNTAQDAKKDGKKNVRGKNIGKVSAAETKQKGLTKNTEVSKNKKSILLRTKEQKKGADERRKELLFIEVQERADSLHEKFPDAIYEKVALVVMENMPECEKLTITDFAKAFGYSRQSLYNRMMDDEFAKIREYFVKRFLKSKTAKVLQTLTKGATFMGPFGPNIPAIKLFLQYAENWSEGLNLNHDVKGGFNIAFGVKPSPFVQPIDQNQQAIEGAIEGEVEPEE